MLCISFTKLLFLLRITLAKFQKTDVSTVYLLGQILAIRAQVEELVVDEESLAYLGEIGQRTSLRSALNFNPY